MSLRSHFRFYIPALLIVCIVLSLAPSRSFANSSSASESANQPSPESTSTEPIKPAPEPAATSSIPTNSATVIGSSNPAATPAQIDEEVLLLEQKCKNFSLNRADKRRLAVLYSQSNKNFEKAKLIFQELAKAHEDTDSLMDLAACYYRTDFEETYKLASKAAQLNNGQEYPIAMVKLAMAGSRYRKNDLAAAENYYLESLNSLNSRTSSVVPRLALAGLAGVQARLGKYEEAADTYRELYKLDRDIYGSEDVECGWSLLEGCYAQQKLKRDQFWKDSYIRAVWAFRKNNADRIVAEYEKKHQTKVTPETMAIINKVVFGNAGSHPPADPIGDGHSRYTGIVSSDSSAFLSPWKKQFKQTEAPGLVWFDPDIPVKCVVVCIHGLGLHHRSFETFARRIAQEGVMTIAMDVRGFGTYVETNGMEKLSMLDCVSDLKSLVTLLRKDYSDLPLFILGESMGGALALRVVAEAPSIVDGLICSVPSGSRHNSLTTAIKVGTNYLIDKRKPMAVGDGVIRQATNKSDLQQSWMNDPSSRLNLSPQELVDFQKFMGENVINAKKITSKPVILFQGHDDKLVKESGTWDLFESLTTPEKSIVILGGTEHLIFESGQFKDDLILSVIGWMRAHSEKNYNHNDTGPVSKP